MVAEYLKCRELLAPLAARDGTTIPSLLERAANLWVQRDAETKDPTLGPDSLFRTH